ncbi:MAG: signal peptidase II, partial [Pseudoflavonifractor sp.]
AIFRRVLRQPAGQIGRTLVLAGAVGNLIDRVLFGYVTDMFMTTFMRFAVFNVADICVVVGGIATCVYIFFFYEKLEKKGEKPDDTTESDG